MVATERSDTLDGAYAPVATPRDQRSPAHATGSADRPRPHLAFLTDGGPTLLLATEGEILTRRAPAVTMILSIGAAVVAVEGLTAGLAANASSQVGSTDTSTAVDPQAIFTIAFAAFVEIALFVITSFCFLFCNFHVAYFLSIGLIGLSALGTGAYGLAVMAISMSNSVCGDSGSCSDALKKGLAAACVRVVLTAPFCLTLSSWYFFKARKELRRFRAELRRQPHRPHDGHDLEPLFVPREER